MNRNIMVLYYILRICFTFIYHIQSSNPLVFFYKPSNNNFHKQLVATLKTEFSDGDDDDDDDDGVDDDGGDDVISFCSIESFVGIRLGPAISDTGPPQKRLLTQLRGE